MRMKKIILSSALYFLVSGISAQDCTLDLGGTNLDTLIKVFQLNDAQIALVEHWQAELQLQMKSIEDEAKELLAKQPQRTEEELLALSQKYKVLRDKMANLSADYDQKLLRELNDKQYGRYVSLCQEALRTPLEKTPE